MLLCLKRGARVRNPPETDPPPPPPPSSAPVDPCPSKGMSDQSVIGRSQAKPVYIIISSKHHLHDQSTAFDPAAPSPYLSIHII